MKPLTLLLLLSLLSPVARGKEEKKEDAAVVSNSKYDDIALFGRVINFIEKQYVDKVNTKELVYGAIKGMLETLEEGEAEGRAACQGPEVDGSTTLTAVPAGARVGDMIEAVVVATEGVDLVADPVPSHPEAADRALSERTR